MILGEIFKWAKKVLHRRQNKKMVKEILGELEASKSRAKADKNHGRVALTLSPQAIDFLEEIIKSEERELRNKEFLDSLPSKK